MALSGSTGSNVGSHWRLELDWSATQNVGGNYSNVTVNLYWKADSYGAVHAGSVSKSGYITIDGQRTNFTNTATLSNGQRKRIAQVTKRVNHSSNGSKQFSISANFGMAVTLSGTYYGSRTISGSWWLNEIARTSSVGFVGGNSAEIGKYNDLYIKINSNSGSFTHTLRYAFAGRSGTVANKIAWVDHEWTVPLDLANAIPNSTSNGGIIYCDTYNGNTLIGTSSASFTATIPSDMVPSFNSLTASEQNSTVTNSGVGGYVQGLSDIKLTINGATGTYSSTIKNYSINYDGQVKGNNGIWNPNYSGSKTATATITDSRGRKASKSISIAVIAYSPPVISSVAASRTVADQSKVTVYRKGSISSLNGKNQMTVTVDSSPKGTGTWGNATSSTSSSTTFESTVPLPNSFSQAQSFDIRVRVTDRFSTSETVASLSSAYNTLSLSQSGIGVGKTWESGALDVEGEANFTGHVMIKPRGTDIPRFQLYSKDTNGHSYVEIFGSDGERKAWTGIGNPTDVDFSFTSEFGGINLRPSSGKVKVQNDEIAVSWDTSTGRVIRFYDGTQICYTNFQWNPNSGNAYVNLAATFLGNYSAVITGWNADLYSLEEISSLTAGQSKDYQVRVVRKGAKARNDLTWNIWASIIAIGRWK